MFNFAKILAMVAVSVSVATAAPAEDARAKSLASLKVHGEEGTVVTDGVEVTYISSPGNGTTLEKRAGAGVYFTDDFGFGGAHIYFPAIPLGLCINMPSPGWQNVVSSFGPDDGLDCYGFHFLGCASDIGQIGPVRKPGVADGQAWMFNGTNWNDKVNSYRCNLR